MKLYKQLTIAALAVFGLAACSDDPYAENVVDPAQPVVTVPEQVVMLVDSQGKPMCSLPSECGRYYLQVTASAGWRLQSNDSYIVPLDTMGYGPKTVSVLVGENWSAERTGSISLYTYDCTESEFNSPNFLSNIRREENVVQEVSVDQMSVANLEVVKKFLSSNRGAGYSYSFNDDYCLGTNIEIFNMLTLEQLQDSLGAHFIEDDYYPQMYQEVYSGKSKKAVDTELAIKASLGVDYNGVTVKVNGNYGQEDKEDNEHEYARMRVLGSMFTREINYMNCVARANESKENYERIFSPGFRLLAQNLEEKLKKISDAGQINDTTVVDPICQNFINEVGPCFIDKAMLGCAMDYSMTVDKSLLKNGLTAGGALELKVGFATGSVDVNAEGQYAATTEELNKNTESTCLVRGGDVRLVSLLVSGGSIDYEKLAEWQLSVSPLSAVLINLKTQPIYSVLRDPLSHDVIEEYITRKTTPKK